MGFKFHPCLRKLHISYELCPSSRHPLRKLPIHTNVLEKGTSTLVMKALDGEAIFLKKNGEDIINIPKRKLIPKVIVYL